MAILRGQKVAQPSNQAESVDASVIVLSYNSQKTIRESLNSLAAQQTSVRFEVIVVDSSTDATPTIVSQEYPWVRLVRLTCRALPGETRNVGIEHAKGNVIAFLASDCVAAPDWLSNRMEGHDEGFAAVGGVITNANPGNLVGWANYLMEYAFCLPNRPREVMKGKLIHNLSYRSDLFNRYGVFPPDLPLGEDTVFNRRLMLGDESVLFDPRVRTGHINPSSLMHLLEHHHGHGKYFMRACWDGELSYFQPTGKLGLPILWKTLVSYPWMRIRTCVKFIFKQNRSLVGPLMYCFPVLVLGIYSAAWGALVESLQSPKKKPAESVRARRDAAA
jgi:glycosyltransferase involved in cell wall biosynthesis